jgi:hypothetical protein
MKFWRPFAISEGDERAGTITAPARARGRQPPGRCGIAANADAGAVRAAGSDAAD